MLPTSGRFQEPLPFSSSPRGEHDLLVPVDAGRNADARRLDHVDDVDEDAGQSWLGAAGSFLLMWLVMMIA